MFAIALGAVAVVAAVGVLVTFLLYILKGRGKVSRRLRISVVELVIGALVLGGIAVPVTLKVGSKLSVNQVLTQNQYYDGVQEKPKSTPTYCYAGATSGDSAKAGQSNCYWTYVSGTYSWTDKICSGTGSSQKCTYIPEQANTYTPYSSVEVHYWIDDSIGDHYDYSGAYVPANARPYSLGTPIPSYVLRGAPPDWLAAMARWKAGDPRSVTAVRSYPNPILGLRNQTGIDNYDTPPPASVIQGYVAKHEVPDSTQRILGKLIIGPTDGDSQTIAYKANFVCVNIPHATQLAWQNALMQFNAQLGMHLHGDLHILIVGGCIGDLHQFTQVVKARWQSTDYDPNTFAKNGVVVVLQTLDGGKTIANADATTGMPYGNNGMIESIRTYLPGTALTPIGVLGHPRTIVDGSSTKYFEGTPVGSLVGIMLFGLYHFVRSCMINCPAGQVGYAALVVQIQPTFEAKMMMLLVVALISFAYWFFVAWTDFLDKRWDNWFGSGRARRRNSFTRIRY